MLKLSPLNKATQLDLGIQPRPSESMVYADYKNVERMGGKITHSPTSKRQTPLKFVCFITGFLHNYVLLKLFRLMFYY